MSGTRKALAPLALAALLAALAGCGGNDRGPGKPADTRSPAQYFKDTQRSTMTPSGKVRIETVQAQGDEIRYETDDGKKWSVGYSKRGDGTYDYQTPRPAE